MAPRETGLADWIGAFARDRGLGAEELVAGHEREHDDYAAIMVKALADRLAEALAEWLHQKARADWGYGRDEALSIEELIRRSTAASARRPAIRPARTTRRSDSSSTCSGARTAVGIQLTETFAMRPAASVCGFYFAHPQARYFALGKIGRDQVLDYHRRKGMDLRAVERWLAPNLDYDPADA